MRVALALLTFATTVGVAASQTITTIWPAQHDPQAVAAVQEALQTLGGFAAWTQIQNATETGSCTDNLNPSVGSLQFIWLAEGLNFRYETRGNDGVQHVLVSGNGRPARSDGSTAAKMSLHAASLMLPYQLPDLVLAQGINDQSYLFRYVGSVTWNQAPAIQIEIVRTFFGHSLRETTQEWYLDSRTMQPMAITFFLPGAQEIDHYAQMTYSYSQYQTVEGVSVPHNILSNIVGTRFQNQCTIGQVQFNTELPSGSFDLLLSNGDQN